MLIQQLREESAAAQNHRGTNVASSASWEESSENSRRKVHYFEASASQQEHALQDKESQLSQIRGLQQAAHQENQAARIAEQNVISETIHAHEQSQSRQFDPSP